MPNPFVSMQARDIERYARDETVDLPTLELMEEALRRRKTRASRQVHETISRLIEVRLRSDAAAANDPDAYNEFDVFLSYAHQDEEHARRIVAELTELGLRIWRDTDRLNPGAPIHGSIAKAIRACKAVLLLASRNSTGSDYVRQECTYAYELNKPIMPYRIDRSDLGELRFLVTGIKWIEGHDRAKTSALRAWANVVRPKARNGVAVGVWNLKGGVGKTTMAANVFGAINQLRHKSVLFLDLDPQANLTQLFLPNEFIEHQVKMGASAISIFEPGWFSSREPRSRVLFEFKDSRSTAIDPTQIAVPLRRFTAEFQRLDLVVGQFELVKYGFPAPVQFDALAANFSRFVKQALTVYDYVVMDTGPTASFIHSCIVQNATHILCPIRPDKYSFEGVSVFDRVLKDVLNTGTPPNLKFVMNAVALKADGEWELKRQRDVYEAYVNRLNLGARMISKAVPQSRMLQAAVDQDFDEPIGALGINNSRIDLNRTLRIHLEEVCDEVIAWTSAG